MAKKTLDELASIIRIGDIVKCSGQRDTGTYREVEDIDLVVQNGSVVRGYITGRVIRWNRRWRCFVREPEMSFTMLEKVFLRVDVINGKFVEVKL